jgi:NADPH:quinone reductase-like Zn-dependent oxidoreductase
MGSQLEFEDIMRLIFAGRLALPIDQVYPLHEARQAEERMREGGHFGKIVLEVSS